MPFLALTMTPSIRPSSAEETLPVRMAADSAAAGRAGANRARTTALTTAKIKWRMGIDFPPAVIDYSRMAPGKVICFEILATFCSAGKAGCGQVSPVACHQVRARYRVGGVCGR